MGLGCGERPEGARLAQLALLQCNGATSRLDELAHLHRCGRFGLELKVAVSKREWSEAFRGELLEAIELLAEMSALWKPIAHRHDALAERATVDVEMSCCAIELE
ncbi:MAG: hypothetical protein AB7L94_23500 [Kofleriaceae bacterium]